MFLKSWFFVVTEPFIISGFELVLCDKPIDKRHSDQREMQGAASPYFLWTGTPPRLFC